jgi:hypothetical protein
VDTIRKGDLVLSGGRGWRHATFADNANYQSYMLSDGEMSLPPKRVYLEFDRETPLVVMRARVAGIRYNREQTQCEVVNPKTGMVFYVNRSEIRSMDPAHATAK